jgi:proteasome lid subunit RPN8/RPN11
MISQDLLQSLFNEAVRRHPHEACGFVLGTVGGARLAKEFVACKNIQNDLHAQDPKTYPRTAETAYVIDPKEQAAVEKRVQEAGLTLIAVFHSHPEHDVYFSPEDRANAAPWGEPLFPHLSYIVASVYGKAVKGASDFCWDAESGDFVEFKLY